MLYQITAQYVRNDNGYTCSRQVPTFYLDSRVQGIVSVDHAEKIAREVIDPAGLAHELHINVSLIL
jgi:hypothetical protein